MKRSQQRRRIRTTTALGLAALLSALCLGGCTETPITRAPEAAGDALEGWRQPLFQGLGGITLPITTSSTKARDYFNQGLQLAFAFNHAAADFAFTEATAYDPDCAMCYWGSALVLGPNVNAPMDPGNAPRAFVLATRASNLAANGTTPWERALIDALLARYAPEAPEDRAPLDEAYADAMRDVFAEHPENATIAALTGEALMDLHPWDFWDGDGTPRQWTTEITDTLEHALQKNPDHAGAIHLYIHAVEQSQTPERAEPYADRLADLAPAAGHLVHMPAHIYMRVGRYHDSTLNNMRATVADDAFIAACRSNSPIYLAGYIPHNWHFGWVTAAMEGWKSKAYELAEGTAARLTKDLLRAPGMAVAQQFLMQPTFARLRFSDWQALLDDPEPDEDLIYARGIWHYGRGRAYAARGDLAAAGIEHAALKTLMADPAMVQLTFFNREGAMPLLAIADLALAGELQAARGDLQAAQATLGEAVAKEDALPYTEPPEWFHPVRHTLGEVQLAAGKPGAAEVTYREDLKIMPRNGWALRGLVNALEAQGKHAEADATRAAFEDAWQHAEIEIEGSRI
ncbi:MAG: hypothetical protein AAF515_23325 [Pseudomonadota bacterium]